MTDYERRKGWSDGSLPKDLDELMAMIETTGMDYSDSSIFNNITPHPRDTPQKVLKVLELAVEWQLPGYERWAVAQLCAAGGPQPRLRWSSRARDGRFMRSTRATSSIGALTCADGEAVVGIDKDAVGGAVQRWPLAGDLQSIGELQGSFVSAVAARSGLVVAGGAHARLAAFGRARDVSANDELSTIRAIAISDHDWIGYGDAQGRVTLHQPGWERWSVVLSAPRGRETEVVALSFLGDRLLCAWASGAAAEWSPSGIAEHPPVGEEIVCAAWRPNTGTLAFAHANGRVRVAGADPTLWRHPGARSLAWSPTGLLASGGDDLIRIGDPSTEPDLTDISCEAKVTAVAFASANVLVSAHDRELVAWDLARSGSLVPSFQPDDAITVVSLDPDDRRFCAAGTLYGKLLEYDGYGLLSAPPAEVESVVYRIVRHRGAWLVASHMGAYRWVPGEEPRLLGERLHLCRSIAAWPGGYAYTDGNEIIGEHGEVIWTLPDEEAHDVCFSRDGELAALGEDGTLLRASAQRPRKVCARSTFVGFDGPDPMIRQPKGKMIKVSDSGIASVGQVPAALRRVAAHNAAQLGAMDTVLTAAGQVTTAAMATGRIVVADDTRLRGYDVLDGVRAQAAVELVVEEADDMLLVILPEPGLPEVAFPRSAIEEHAASRGKSIESISQAVYQGGVDGDLLWQAGLDLAVDRARGPDHDQAVQVRWRCPPSLDDLPWELIRPASAAAGWFDSPPVTMVRVVEAAAPPIRHAANRRPEMKVVCADDPAFKSVTGSLGRLRRRTRHTAVSLRRRAPAVVGSRSALDLELTGRIDILQMWAHSGPTKIHLSPDGTFVHVSELAELIARTGPRLVVMVGCTSGALGRALVARGVEAAVAMRVEVANHSIEPLVEEFVTLALQGERLDLAFAAALHRYLLTGQPGAAAVPLLYLAAWSGGRPFPS